MTNQSCKAWGSMSEPEHPRKGDRWEVRLEELAEAGSCSSFTVASRITMGKH